MMMPETPEEFSDLAWRSLEAPEDSAVRKLLGEALSAHPEWTAVWTDLREAHRDLQACIPAACAVATADSATSIPAARLAQLLRNVPGAPVRRRWWPWLGAAAIAAVAALVMILQPQKEENFDWQPWRSAAPASLVRALTSPWQELVQDTRIPVLRDAPALQLQSPLVATAAGRVIIAWRDAPSEALTAVIRQGTREISRQTGPAPLITPPLAPDAVYELSLWAGAQRLTEERFVTITAPDRTEAGLAAVLQAATAQPVRLGEAVLAWHALDDRTRHADTGRRLGIWLAVEARQPDILAEISRR
jgi:hypothetical protein